MNFYELPKNVDVIDFIENLETNDKYVIYDGQWDELFSSNSKCEIFDYITEGLYPADNIEIGEIRGTYYFFQEAYGRYKQIFPDYYAGTKDEMKEIFLDLIGKEYIYPDIVVYVK